MLWRNRLLSGILAGSLFRMGVQAAPLDSLSQRLARGVLSLKNKNVAVLVFPYHDGKFSSGSSIISERLTTLLIDQKGIRVIERRLIQQLFAEKKLSETGLIDPDHLKEMGSVLNVDAIITGTLIDLAENRTEINARMIKTDSGEVLSAAREIIARSWDDDPVAPRVQKSSNPPAKSTMQEMPRERVEEAEAASSRPAPSGKALRLSNESFPPARRIYHSGRPKGKPRKKIWGLQRDDDRFGHDRTDEDTYDAPRNSREKTNNGYQKQTTTYEEPTIQHPTQIGEIR